MKKLALALVAMSMFIIGCARPFQEEKYVNIAPNETAFVIPLEGATLSKQGKFNSKEYLESMKVAAKRIIIPQRWHATGRLNNDGEWIPTVEVIKVDRSPVTREWTNSAGTGTSNKTEGIEVESKESIGFTVGVTISASVPEENTATFLYYYSGKQLKDVIDLNVRSYVQDYLSKEFSKYTLDTARSKKADIFNELRNIAQAFFAEKGIHIENIGASGQFSYLEKEIQNAINAKFVAEMNDKTTDDEVKAANKFMTARNSIEAQQNLSVDIELKKAYAEYLRKWNGQYPTTMAGDLGSLAQMGMAGMSMRVK